ncbi:hypothetical protein CFBP8129_47660 (plasmid) [Xanthomonas hortorum pv. gardneri]|uniref:Uncharacterized protein n=2 Tax=Xanthomonas hortorum TaxID=56454 RepID=A0A6V7FMQ1_9XANT|nr:hypothetical protein CFBP8129_47660 [Xanthomonas hortorum pv. gardneri]CAD0364277.1 hypothetical protein CFBP8129_47660 [Xanthomonas hortorum pv. gardneri]
MHAPHGTACARSGSGGPCTWSIAAPGPRQRSTQATARSSITCKGQHAPPGRPHHSLLTRFCQHRGRPRVIHGQRASAARRRGGWLYPSPGVGGAVGHGWAGLPIAARPRLVLGVRPTAAGDQVVPSTWSPVAVGKRGATLLIGAADAGVLLQAERAGARIRADWR